MENQSIFPLATYAGKAFDLDLFEAIGQYDQSCKDALKLKAKRKEEKGKKCWIILEQNVSACHRMSPWIEIINIVLGKEGNLGLYHPKGLCPL